MLKHFLPNVIRRQGTVRSNNPAGEPSHSEATTLILSNVSVSHVLMDGVRVVYLIKKGSVNPGEVREIRYELAGTPLQLRETVFLGGEHTSLTDHRDIVIHHRQGGIEPVIRYVGTALNRAKATTKFVKTQLGKPPTTPYALRKQANNLKENLEQIIEAIVDKRFAERVLARAEEVAELPEVLAPTHTPGYEAAVKAGADIRARIISGSEMVNSVELAKLMSVSRETVNQRRQKGTLLALSHGTRRQHYPAWQLEPKVGEAMPELLGILRPLDPWTQYLFFTQRSPELDGMSPLDVLRNGESDRVIAVATQYADMMAPA